jgi:hypothetical protein
MASQPVVAIARARSPRSGPARATPGTSGGPGFEAAVDLVAARALMADGDAGTRQRIAMSLQRKYGNAAVQRLLASRAPLAVQRWAVKLDTSETNCEKVADYIDKNTPYKDPVSSKVLGWARTKGDFAWKGTPVYGTQGKATTATVTGPTVTKTVAVDMPEWSPTDAVMKRAWAKAMKVLRAHETTHEGVVDTWQATLKSNLDGLQVTVADKTDAGLHAAAQPKWDTWIGQYKAAQKVLDPFSVLVDCESAVEEEEESASAAGSEGATGEGGPEIAEAASEEADEGSPATT